MTPPAKAVLLVDDDPSMRTLLSRAVAEMGFTPRTAASRVEAEALLRAEEFEVLVTDVSLESPDAGVALAQEAAILRPDLPVILITGYPDLGTALPALRTHAFDYLPKPFPISEFQRVLRRAAAARAQGAPEREEIAAAYSELKKVEKTREGMLAIVNHELRTPMCAAMVAAEEIDAEPCGPQGRRLREILKHGLKHLDASIADILLHARLSAGLRPRAEEAVSPVKLAAEAAQALAQEAAALDVRVEVSGNPGDTAVRGDRIMLSRAVHHLLSNAVHFNRRGGLANVAVRLRGSAVEIVIGDEGGGIPPEQIQRVFDPYYQVADYLTRTSGGLGLGLAISRAVFEGHGGGVRVDNRPGSGCEFTAWLPTFSPADA